MENKNREFERFDALATKLLRVPHATIKAKLEAEKAAKTERPKRKRKQSEQK